MANQYMWLRKNLDRYQYITDNAKKLYEEYKGISASEDVQPTDDVIDKLEDCYKRFIEMFNNNPYNYKNGLKESEIETNEFDCYFVTGTSGPVPVGYYKANRSVECVLLLNEKIEKQQKKTQDVKARLFETFENETKGVDTDFIKFTKAKKAKYIRAIVPTIACIMALWYGVKFLNITNVVTIIKSIGDAQQFTDAVTSGMSNMPFWNDTGVVGWFVLLIVHIFVIIIAIRSIKSIKKEYVLTHHKGITSKLYKKTKETVARINSEFEQNIANDTQKFQELARQGANGIIEKDHFANLISKIRKNIKIAKEYLKLDLTELRGIKSNYSVVFFAVIAVCMYFSYTIITDEICKAKIDTMSYDIQVKMDKSFLRSKKIVQLNAENCPIYSGTSTNSKVKNTLPIWTEVELKEKIIISGESWSKIKKITDTDIITGWVPTVYTVPYNKVEYNSFEEIGIIAASASSHLVGDKAEYLPEFAYDWNRQTSWQDGNEYSTGKGEYITFNFAETTTVNMIQIFPGNAKEEDLYWRNERIKKAKLKFSNDKSVTYEFDDSFTEAFQTIWLNKPVETDFVTIEILETYEGTEYTDLCISEVHMYKFKQ